jgi:hypothetical protein
MQLSPHAGGYVLIGLTSVSTAPGLPGGWSLTLTSTRSLGAFVDAGSGRPQLLEGTYITNAAAVAARYVLTPTAAVHLTVAARLRLPLPMMAHEGDAAAATAASPTAAACNSCGAAGAGGPVVLPNYMLRLYDTCGAREVVWSALPSYHLVAEALGSPSTDTHGSALLPNIQLQPGRYLLQLALCPGSSGPGGNAWVDPDTGAVQSPPSWQLLLAPSDERVMSLSACMHSIRHTHPACILVACSGQICCLQPLHPQFLLPSPHLPSNIQPTAMHVC